MIIDRFDIGFSSANTTGYVLDEMVISGGFQVGFWNPAPKKLMVLSQLNIRKGGELIPGRKWGTSGGGPPDCLN